MRQIYIAGPITGMPNENKEAFYAAAVMLEDAGWVTVANPHEIGTGVRNRCNDDGIEVCAQDYMDDCIAELISGDAIYLLQGWENSAGASLEAAIAKVYGLDFYDHNGQPMETPAEIVIRKGYPKRR